MELTIKTLTTDAKESLKQVVLDSQKKMARLIYSVSVLEDEPYTILFNLKKIPSLLAKNEVIQNTVINGLKEQLNQDYNINPKEIEVSLK